MKRLRVLTCTFTCCVLGKPGFGTGEGVLGWNLLKQIARFHDVWTLTHADERPSIERALQEESISNIRFCYVDLPSWLHPLLRFQGGHQLYYYLWQIKAYFTARKLNNSVGFELFHHITYANDWMVSFIGAFLPVPYIRGPGGGAHRTPRGFELEYSFHGRLWEKIRTLGQWIFRHDPIFMRGQARARAILVCNNESMSEMSRKWSDKTRLFPVSGVSSEELVRSSQPTTDHREFRVLSAGTLIRVKGFSLAIKAFKEFVDIHPAAKFSIVGSGPEEQQLRALVRREHIHDKVLFLGWKPHHEVLSEMASHDVFLFPSLRDGGGTVVVEAMAVGKPVICLDAGGPGMHVTPETGLKVAANSPRQAVRDLSEALEKLYLHQELRVSLGSAARERVERFYLWDRLGERLMAIYHHSLNSKVPAKAP